MVKKEHLLTYGLCLSIFMSTFTTYAAPITQYNSRTKRKTTSISKNLKKKQKQLDIKWEKNDNQEDAWISYATTDWYKDQEDLICSFKNTRVGDSAEIFGYEKLEKADAATADRKSVV